VALHTHPNSLPFSVTDIAVLLAQPGLRLVAAVCRNGSWYLASARTRSSTVVVVSDVGARVAALRDTFARYAEATASAYRVPPYTSERAARRAHLHDVWQRAAPALGLLYDRVEGKAGR
jgi:hypothetical protein